MLCWTKCIFGFWKKFRLKTCSDSETGFNLAALIFSLIWRLKKKEKISWRPNIGYYGKNENSKVLHLRKNSISSNYFLINYWCIFDNKRSALMSFNHTKIKKFAIFVSDNKYVVLCVKKMFFAEIAIYFFLVWLMFDLFLFKHVMYAFFNFSLCVQEFFLVMLSFLKN